MSSIKMAQAVPPQPATTNIRLPPPFIHVPALPNLRDVGGLPVSNPPPPPPSSTPSSSKPASFTIRPKLLYRAADPSHVPAAGIATLHSALAITTIFDLRSAPEISNAGGVSDWESRIAAFNAANGTALTRHWTPVFKAEDYGPEAVAMRFRSYGDADSTRGFVRAYEAILEHGATAFGIILRHVARGGGGVGGTLVHCTAGKDRTGVLVAIVLALCGVDAETIGAEYQLTETGLGERRPYLIARLVATGAFGEGEEAARSAERMTGSRKESMVATLAFVEERWGSVEAYVRDVCGCGQEVIDGIRRRFVVEGEKEGVGGGEQSVL
jgi:protein tyrosine/serine phosphatase